MNTPAPARTGTTTGPTTGRATTRPPVVWTEATATPIVHGRSMGRCEICWTREATDRAHRVARSQGGTWSPTNLLHLCPGHHAWCHAHPDAARTAGWILPGGTDPDTVPAHITHEGAPRAWWWLTWDPDVDPADPRAHILRAVEDTTHLPTPPDPDRRTP